MDFGQPPRFRLAQLRDEIVDRRKATRAVRAPRAQPQFPARQHSTCTSCCRGPSNAVKNAAGDLNRMASAGGIVRDIACPLSLRVFYLTISNHQLKNQ